MASALLALAVVVAVAVSAASSHGVVPAVLLKTGSAPAGGFGTAAGGSAESTNDAFEDSANMKLVKEPTKNSFPQMRPHALQFLKRIGVKPDKVADTDLVESCGAFMTPCLATVGACVDKHAVEGPDGEVTVDTAVCNCFASSLVDEVKVPGYSGVAVQCDYTCLDSINGLFNEYLEKKNGETGARAFCEHTFTNMAEKQFGTENHWLAKEGDLDSLTVMPLSDPKVARAGSVLREYINNVRAQKCPLRKALQSEPHVAYAKVGMEDNARYEYRIEAIFDDEEFAARISHLPPDQQLADPANAAQDPRNYLGRFKVVTMSPEPCATGNAAVLASTAVKVASINSQQLSWRAEHREVHHGKTAADFGMGLKKPPLAAIQAKRVSLSTSGFIPPKEFRASDQRADEQDCRAYDVLDQGSCGSCYAFAAATAFSARMCGKTDEKWNIVASPQEMMDCSNGCDGGWPLSVYEEIANDKTAKVVEKFCDPYTEKKDTCGGYCPQGNTYSGIKGTAVIVGDASADGIKQIQLELMKNGPGAMALDVYDDFYTYTSGVYVKSATAQKRGAHAVTLIGWGEEDGVPYWLVQNSWGANSGDKGFWKIRRGTNEADIETYGLTVVQPEVPSFCPNLECKNKARMLKDCSCSCNGGWSGESCDTCELNCQNGGVVADDCSKCVCPDGYSGIDCHGGFTLSSLAGCGGESKAITIDWKFGGAAKAPTQKSFVGLYAKTDETNSFNMVHGVYLCGDSYDKTSNDGLCPNTGSIIFKNSMPAAGKYKVAIVRFQPPNEFGQEGYSTTLTHDDTVGLLTVLESGKCDEQSVAAAAKANSPITLLTEKLARLKAQEVTCRVKASMTDEGIPTNCD